ncbi:MAG: 2-iminoacetate synthase ThiH [Bacteroidota bacterium]
MFSEEIHKYDWNEVKDCIYSKKAEDVEKALASRNPGPEDFKALLSPAAAPYIETMASLSRVRTQERFGKVIQLYLPLYLSNQCNNQCVYCGFNGKNEIDRVTLSEQEIMSEVNAIKKFGYEHILLVTGEDPVNAGFEYLLNSIKLIKPYFSLISIEVQPLETEEYSRLAAHGLNTVYVYQETYHPGSYKNYHPGGKKMDYRYRLDTPDRIGNAGIHRIGLGTLLGLEDWRTDAFFTSMHLKYLEKKYWKTKYSISFPRLRPHAGKFHPPFPVSDAELVQLICAYRLLNREVELSISVRESRKFRDHIVQMGITSMSAGSRTEPGGYSLKKSALEQFEIHDNRTADEICRMITEQGYEAVWKDWDAIMQI